MIAVIEIACPTIDCPYTIKTAVNVNRHVDNISNMQESMYTNMQCPTCNQLYAVKVTVHDRGKV
jgi:hypothetical protein